MGQISVQDCEQVQQHGVDLAIDQKVIAKFFARIDALKSMFNGEASQKITFTLDDDAQKLFNAKHDEIIRSRDAAADPLATHIAKYPGLLGRIILVLWLLTAETAQVRTTAEGKERHWQGFENLVVPKEIVESAFVFLEYLQGHAEVWYEKAAQKPGAKEGLRIAKWLLENHPTSVTLRDVYRVKKLKLDKGSAALGLQWLDTMNWGNWEPNRKAAGPGGGRESASFEVNPRTAVFGTIGTGQSR